MKIENCYSVSEINTIVKGIFKYPLFQNITIKGEISNYRGRNKSGHIYFSLKDEKSVINVAIFRNDTYALNFEPKNGDFVYAFGDLSSYPPSGTYQLICKEMMLQGQGDLFLKKELLKEKLSKEGLFLEEHKKELPKYPESIAIITGKNSAAAKDFEFNINRRYPISKVTTYYTLVQGHDAPREIIKALHEAENSNPDVIILGRGGGSSDDLIAFDDENLVREVYNCKIPIITAIGHEINLSLCDLVADKHASTPTGAVELAVPNIDDVLKNLFQIGSYSYSLIKNKLSTLESRLSTIKSKKCFADVEYVFEDRINFLQNTKITINSLIYTCLDKNLKRIEILSTKLHLVNPSNILDKGYSLLFTKDGEVVKEINELKNGDDILIKTRGGKIIVKVEEVVLNGK